MNGRIELLSPAKDFIHGKAALDFGADAVYIGAPRFSAREAAGSSIDEIENLARYAHRFNAKVYVALNTLLFDAELDKAAVIARDAWNAGADALIIQDMGLVLSELPPIPLFASTQAHNDTPDKVHFLEQAGFSRVILARELSLSDIRSIRAASTIDLESFVHGALCVSYSGQCYMSYACGGRSGNRGQCAQPCRMRYSLEDAQGTVLIENKHLLSLKDLNLTERIGEMIAAGISSFKIEGRLKDISYVKNVTAHYRQAIDRCLGERTKSSTGRFFYDFTPAPEKAFSRGFTRYFIDGRKDPVASWETPKQTGEYAGRILSVNGRRISVQSSAVFSPGDGICFFAKDGSLSGGYINAVDGQTLTLHAPASCSSGTDFWRNYDYEFEKKLAASKSRRFIPVEFFINADFDASGLRIRVQDCDGIAVEEFFSETIEPAENAACAKDMIIAQFSKSGETCFTVDAVHIADSDIFFLPVKRINEIRRMMLDALAAQRDRAYTREVRKESVSSLHYPCALPGFESNIINKKAQEFYEKAGAVMAEPGAESGLSMKSRRVMKTKYCLRHESGCCPRYPLKGVLTGEQNNPEPWHLVSENAKFRLEFNCAECVMELYVC